MQCLWTLLETTSPAPPHLHEEKRDQETAAVRWVWRQWRPAGQENDQNTFAHPFLVENTLALVLFSPFYKYQSTLNPCTLCYI